MKTVSGFPYFEVQFTKDGDVDDAAEVSALRDYLKKPNATDLIVISHGWNNDMSDARKLYAKFLACLRDVLDGKPVAGIAGRSFARHGRAVAVDEVRRRGPDSERRRGDRLRREHRSGQKQLDRLEKAVGTAGKSKIRSARALVPALANDPKAREKFADLVRSALPQRRRRRRGRVERRFSRGRAATSWIACRSPSRRPRPGRRAAAPTSIGSARGGAAGIGDTFSGVLAGARNLLNYATYYLMKERAGDVGRGGVNGVLRDLKKVRPDLRLHLVGHSFGGRLVTAARGRAGRQDRRGDRDADAPAGRVFAQRLRGQVRRHQKRRFPHRRSAHTRSAGRLS